MKINSNQNYIAEGLVHKIYKYNENIYKVPKDEFEDFNNSEHFLIEQASHEILRRNSLPAIEVIKVYERDTLIEGKCALKERFVPGVIVDNKDLTNKQMIEIISVLMKVNKIKVLGYGNIDYKGKGQYDSWHDYLVSSIKKFNQVLRNNAEANLEIYFDYLFSNLKNIPSVTKGYFLILDTNSNNYIFNEQQKVVAMLDVDHPISGDKLYEYAALSFHHPKTFEILNKESGGFNENELKLLKYYFIHFGISTIVFELRHNLDITNSLEILKNAQI